MALKYNDCCVFIAIFCFVIIAYVFLSEYIVYIKFQHNSFINMSIKVSMLLKIHSLMCSMILAQCGTTVEIYNWRSVIKIQPINFFSSSKWLFTLLDFWSDRVSTVHSKIDSVLKLISKNCWWYFAIQMLVSCNYHFSQSWH